MGAYQVPKDGVAALVEKLNSMQRQINELRSSAGTSSQVITGADGSRVFIGNGNIQMWDDYASNPEGFGRIYVDPVSGARTFRMFPPYSAGTGLENSVTMRGTSPSTVGAFWIYTDGVLSLDAGERVYVNGSESVDIVTPKLRLYGLGTTGTAPNLALEISGTGEPVVKLVTSSERDKTDIAPIEVDVDEVLAYTGITWVHKDTIESSVEGPIRRNVGHHAEAMDRFPSLRQFVNYDEDGFPASVQEGRFEVAVLEVVKALWSRTNDQDAQIAALSARLDALESAA